MNFPSAERLFRLVISGPAMAGLLVCAAGAQSVDRAHVEEVLRGLNRGHGGGQVAVSPDGKQLAWIAGGRGGGEILVAPIDDLKKTQHVTAATKPDQHCSENDLTWEPDSKALAFFSDCASSDGQHDLYLSRVDGTPAKRLTQLKGYVHEAAFSPDGSKIAFLYVAGATRPAGALAAMKLPSGVIGEDGVEVQRVAYADAAAATPADATLATPANLHAYEYDWAPDSKGFAYVAAAPPGENNWWVAKLYTQTLGSEPKAVLAPAEVAGALHGLQIAVPRWSPDGKTIAFIGGLMSDQGSTGGDVWIVSAQGGAPRDLTAGRPTSPAWVEWSGNDYLFVSELAGGNNQLIRLHLQGDRTGDGAVTFGSPIFSIPGSVGDGRWSHSLSSTADHSMFVFEASTFEKAPEIYGAKPGTVMSSGLDGVMQLSHLNDGVEPAWGKAVSLSWKNDNFRVQGWLLLPKDYDPNKRYPLIVEVHGGPASAVQAAWGGRGGLSATAFSALGYFVLEPNPRGSFGQGEDFTKANRKDFGYGDLQDILKGVDTVLAKYPVDPNRVGITGWSYGGFMTMFAVTQTNRFKAAVAGAGISNWQSYYGENSIDQWMIPYFGASVYDDPAVYARESAINFIKNVKTPTLVVVGDRDGECPAPQSYEFWHALRDEHVPTQLVIYPNEGHGFVNPEHRRDVMDRAVEWFAKYLPAGEGSENQAGANR
ncbi:S9 family peptidase [Occallatibacter riparius]|uniref:S9 family peptidase n=1 Tax=Occallatibacter riparius TaxID=1002689 RepID=A0A9J7BVC3_9BACT|nr:S9 family peptidase [Occallatibacter riparius]UWZ86576.1 S9 family peptidase [Occallatibacter riparius]